MSKPTHLCDYELSEPFDDRSDLHRYGEARVLLRLHGRPIGQPRVPIVNGRVDLQSLRRRIVRDYSPRFATLLAERAIAGRALPTMLEVDGLFVRPSSGPAPSSTVTVAVCTRDRTEDLARCVTALLSAADPGLDVVVIDN